MEVPPYSVFSHIHQSRETRETHENFPGYAQAIRAYSRALGLISFGRPINLISFGADPSLGLHVPLITLSSHPSSPLLHACHPSISPPENLASHASISFHAPSFKKLCTSTILSTASSGVSSYPLRRMALYICCGEGYSQFELESPRGMEEVVREVGREIRCWEARSWEMVAGM